MRIGSDHSENIRTIVRIKPYSREWQEYWNWLVFSFCLRMLGNRRAGELQRQTVVVRARRGRGAHFHCILLAVGLLLAQNAKAWDFSGIVWNDANHNGILDPGEVGIPGVTVEVRNCSNNNLVATAKTASDGSFIFTDTVVPLSANYHVHITGLPAGYKITTQIYPPPTNGPVVSTVDPSTGYAPCFIFSQLTNSTLNNAGIFKASATTASALAPIASCPGDSVVFSTTASGTGPFTYSWRKNGTTLAGQTTNSLAISPVSSTNAGLYSVIVKGFLNSVTNSATLTVNTNVSATPLTNLTVVAGNSATFSTVPSGTGPFSYTWFKDGTQLASQTTNTLTISPVTPTDAGLYAVVVHGICHSVTNCATLTVNVPTTATALANLTECAGGMATFDVTASGTGPFSYVWLKNGTVIAGQTTNTLAISPVNTVNAGFYSVIVTGAANSVTNSATLTVNTPVATTALTNLTVVVGSSATFSTIASGSGPFVYSWSKDGAPLAGQTTNSLAIPSAAPADAGIYSVIVNGACGSMTNSASLTVNVPTSVSALADVTECVGDIAVFNVTTFGTGPFSYVWLKDGTALAGQTTNSLTISPLNTTNAGTYAVVVTGAANSVTNSATLTVNTPMSATPLTNVTVVAGSGVTFSTIASGSGPFSYLWFKDGVLLASQTTNSLTIPSSVPTNAGTYSLVVSGACGSVTNSGSLTVNVPTSASALADVTECVGGIAIFNVTASGTGPFAYVWFKDGTLLAGQTTNTLTISPVNITNEGVYSVVVAGAANSVTNSATLAVNTLVSATPLTNLTVVSGSSATFSTIASGSGPFSYLWSKDGASMAGQSTNSLTIQSAAPTDAGVYSIIVNGACGSVTNSASLTVNVPTSASALANLTECAGGLAIFNVTASGTGPFSYVWFKDGTVLTGQTTNTLTISPVNTTNAGLYSVIVAGAANSVTNFATLTVNTPVSATPMVDLVVCQGDNAAFNTVASGTGPFQYAWFKDGALLAGQTTNSIMVGSATAIDAGTYAVQITGTCSTITNSASLTVNLPTTTTAITNIIKNAGDGAAFTTTPAGTGPFSYVWLINGVIIPGQTTNTLTISPVNATNTGLYSVEVSGACNTVTNQATLTLNAPPSVTIISPTNGATFIALANMTVLATAQSLYGTISKVDFFSGTNFIGESIATGPPYFTLYTNVTPGNYTLTAIATDSLGATGTSAPVNITVADQPPIVAGGPPKFNPQTDMFEQPVRVTNPTYYAYASVRLLIGNLPVGIQVYNASGVTNAIPFVQSLTSIAPGASVNFTVEFFDLNRVPPNPTYTAQLVAPMNASNAVGPSQPINRIVQMPSQTVLVEFSSISNRVYYVQYSSDMLNWKTSIPAITGIGGLLDWIDSGQPKTDSPPSSQSTRYYRVILLP
jgi:hypothetical protein